MTHFPALRFMRGFQRDERGVSAVEFALLAPVMIIIFFGVSVFCMGFMAHKRMAHTNSAVADMVAQSASVDGDDLDDILSVGVLLMQPFPESTLDIRVTSVTRKGGRDLIDWSRGREYAARKKGDTYPGIPAGLIAEGEGLIVTEAAYDHQSPVDYFLPSVTKFEAIHFVRPRLVNTTVCTDC